MSTTRIRRRLHAPRDRIYAALIDADDVRRWKFPRSMAMQIHEFSGVEGGSYRISLSYTASDRAGKTTAHTDTYRGRFERLVPGELVVEVDEFETADPALAGPMTITITLTDAPEGGTELTARHEGLPRGVDPDDNALGWQEALDRLAELVEPR